MKLWNVLGNPMVVALAARPRIPSMRTSPSFLCSVYGGFDDGDALVRRVLSQGEELYTVAIRFGRKTCHSRMASSE